MRKAEGVKKVELLAPGGTMEGIKAAVCAGADAVYAGGRLFGARAYAANPDDTALLDAIDYCHRYGVRLYLTVNTLLKERELEEMLYDFIRPLYAEGVDAVLVQDLGVFHFLRRAFPDLPLHASTQMTITGSEGAKLLAEMGADRVVLSRELSLDDIRAVRRETDVELETFVHGALCYCYSGQCLASSMLGDRSGNRGRCAQPCRLPYDVALADDRTGEGHRTEEKRAGTKDRAGAGSKIREGAESRADIRSRRGAAGESLGRYLLSLKDICTLQILPDLIDAGISSLKIEGRMKRPEYAAGVTAIYRKYIDLYEERGREGYRVDDRDLTALTDLFCRGGFSQGYYGGQKGPFMMSMVRPNHSGSPAARVLSGTGQKITLRATEDLAAKDALLVGGREVLVREPVQAGQTFQLRLPDAPCKGPGRSKSSVQSGRKAEKNIAPFFAGADQVQRGQIVRRIRAQSLLDRLGQTYVKGRPGGIPASGEVRLCPGQPVRIAVSACGKRAEAAGALVREAQKRPLTEEEVRRQTEKRGDSPFRFSQLTVTLTGDCFLPIQDLNRVRREALDQLETEILQDCRRSLPGRLDGEDPPADRTDRGIGDHPALTASVRTLDQLQAVLCWQDLGGIYLESSLFVYPESSSPASLIRKVHEAGKRAYLALPPIWTGQVRKTFGAGLDPDQVRLFDGLLLRSVDQLESLKTWKAAGEVVADAGLYTWNREAQIQLRELGVTWDTCPYELTAGELRGRDLTRSELVVYGRLPLMVTAQCLRKNRYFCLGKPSILKLMDRKKMSFPVLCECAYCTNIIYNSLPLDLVTADRDCESLGGMSHRYSFTTEDGKQVAQIMAGHLPASYTRGHLRKGVE